MLLQVCVLQKLSQGKTYKLLLFHGVLPLLCLCFCRLNIEATCPPGGETQYNNGNKNEHRKITARPRKCAAKTHACQLCWKKQMPSAVGEDVICVCMCSDATHCEMRQLSTRASFYFERKQNFQICPARGKFSGLPYFWVLRSCIIVQSWSQILSLPLFF